MNDLDDFNQWLFDHLGDIYTVVFDHRRYDLCFHERLFCAIQDEVLNPCFVREKRAFGLENPIKKITREFLMFGYLPT